MTDTRSIETPTPVLAVTTRVDARALHTALAESVAALRETARRAGVLVVDVPLRVTHADPMIVEVCLPVDRLPDVDPPPPVAAELLVPGTTVEVVSVP